MHSMIVWAAHLHCCRHHRWPFGCCLPRHLPLRRRSYCCRSSHLHGAAKSGILQKIISTPQMQRLTKERRRWSREATSERAGDASSSTTCVLQKKLMCKTNAITQCFTLATCRQPSDSMVFSAGATRQSSVKKHASPRASENKSTAKS